MHWIQTLDPTETLAFYVIVILVLFTVLAAIADLATARAERRFRAQARAEERAKRKKEDIASNPDGEFSWQD